MQIDVISGASVESETESSVSPPEAAKTHDSFADLLAAVAEDQNESTAVNDADDDDAARDEWITVPVVVPFVPVIPQDTVKAEDAHATSVEVIGEDMAVVRNEAVPPEVIAWSDVKSTADNDVPKPAETKTRSESAAAIDVPALDRQAVDRQVINSVPDAAASVRSKESPRAAAAPKPDIVAKAASDAAAPKVPELNEVNKALAAEATVERAVQTGVAEKLVPNEDAGLRKTTNEPVAAAKGVAARFARALERATEQAVAPTAQGGENSQASNQHGGGQPSLGEWLREQLPQLNASRGHHSANPVFTLTAPTKIDAHVSGLLASSGPSALSNMPMLPNEHNVNLQIVQSIRMQFRDGIGEAILKLEPEHLGSVSITLKVENGGLKANVQADMPAVRQWLESQQDTLRSALAEHGLRLDQFDVEPDAQRQRADEDSQRKQSKKRQAQQLDAEQPVFEVVV